MLITADLDVLRSNGIKTTDYIFVPNSRLAIGIHLPCYGTVNY